MTAAAERPGTKPADEERPGQKPADDRGELAKDELAARVSARYWLACQQHYAKAETDLANAVYTDFTDHNATLLIERYQRAAKTYEEAEKALGQTGHIDANARKEHEVQVQTKHDQKEWRQLQAGRSHDEVLQAQQEDERKRTILENEQAQMVMDARRGPAQAPPGINPHPPEPEKR